MNKYLINLEVKYTQNKGSEITVIYIDAGNFSDAEKEVNENFLKGNIEKINIIQILKIK